MRIVIPRKYVDPERRAKKIADIAWSKAIKERDGHKCAICGRTDTLNSHHLLAREIQQYRWDVYNGICLCIYHHKFCKENSPHCSPIMFYKWLQKNRPELYTIMWDRADLLIKND